MRHEILHGLNPEQSKAVQALNGPLLILAGAGSGKTRVLTHRMANIIIQGMAAPDEILAVTFTNKAAREMESRIFKIISDLGVQVFEPLWVSTFHSFCVRVLRQHLTLLDYKPYFAIYDDGDQLSQIKKVLNALGINEKMFPAKTFKNRINNAKMLGLGPAEAEKSSFLYMDQKSLQVYALYEQEMKKANALDFGDLLLKTYEIFRMYPDILQAYQEKFKFIMVDEYQDTNHIQYLLVKELAKAHRNLCVVGDEDQSIYSWRGADISNILNFEKEFPEALIIKLEENYRSTANIVNAATKVIRHNTERKDKTLFTQNSAGEKILVREEKNEYDEARWVTKQIMQIISSGDGEYSDIAIFYRTNAQSRVLEEQLRSNNIPHRLVGGVRFYERMEIKDILAYLKLSINPADDIAFKRVINTPARGIGKTTVEKIEAFAFEQKIPLLAAALKACDNRMFNSGTTQKIRHFLNLIDDLSADQTQNSLLDFYQIVLEKTEYVQRLKVEETPEAATRIENLEELSNAMSQFMKERADSSLQTFLEEMALVSDVDSLDANEQINSVTLMTLHVSKGLEFPFVFIVGMEENLFPSFRADEDEGEQNFEEERRLCYVGMTRARQKLHLTHARSRKVWGQEQFNPPSRFLKEIPPEFVIASSGIETPRFVSQFASRINNAEQSGFKTSGSRQKDFYEQDFPDYDDSSSSQASRGQSGNDLQKGNRVRHPTFGLGTVFQTEGSGDQLKISVLFADQTIKKFVAKYARLERA